VLVSTMLFDHWMISWLALTYAQNIVNAMRKLPRSCRRFSVSRTSMRRLRAAIHVTTRM
jgi:hypothetical protein